MEACYNNLRDKLCEERGIYVKKKQQKSDFSVLMSIYYKEDPKALQLCLDSILKNQTVVPNEIVLVKDGPLTKELDKIIDTYDKKYPKIFHIIPLKQNGGLGSALQLGLTKCKNEIVMRMDTDDICVNNRFALQLQYMEKHPEVSIVGGYIGEFQFDPSEELRVKAMPCTFEEVKKYAKFRNPLNHMTVCFRKSDILEVGNYQPVDYLEDHYLWARLLANGKKIENIPEVLVYARIGNGFEERRGSKKYITGWKMLQNYMYDQKLINGFEKVRNMMGMYAFIYMPSGLRKFLYKTVLRKK